MTHVVTRACCSDASCVPACPVNCIHPAPGEETFAAAEMVFIDPDTCIDCGACVDVCPVSAIVADYELEPADEPFARLNAAYFSAPVNLDYPTVPPARPAVSVRDWPDEQLRVALVGTGPAASYTLDALLTARGLEPQVTVLDRLLTPGGLVRHGVAPDHQDTKAITDQLGRLWRRRGVSLQLGVEVGVDVTVDDLLESHHAVVLATGASRSRHLDLPGEDLPGCLDAERFVGWYNGHPDHAELQPDLSGHRAVVIGNGNVALDLARMLLADEDSLDRSDVADDARAALARSTVREVDVIGRRSPVHAAFTVGELYALDQLAGVTVVVDPRDLPEDVVAALAGVPASVRPVLESKLAWLRRHTAVPPAGTRRINLRFGLVPGAVLGRDTVEGLELTGPDDAPVRVEAGLVITSVGFLVDDLAGIEVPDSGIRHERGRLTHDASSGRYVVGWAKRGPSGGIGTNKRCAQETVDQLLADFVAGALATPRSPVRPYAPGSPFGAEEWQTLDRHERQLGRAAGHPRRKLTTAGAQRAAGTR